jgi:hypothetical protein
MRRCSPTSAATDPLAVSRKIPAVAPARLSLERVALWAIYSDGHAEVDVIGDREGLHLLAEALASHRLSDLTLGEPPRSWQASGYKPLDGIRIEPSPEPGRLIRFQRDRLVLVVSGSTDELSRIISGPVAELAYGPATTNGVGSHLHLDPTSDPEGRYYAPGSASLVIELETET